MIKWLFANFLFADFLFFIKSYCGTSHKLFRIFQIYIFDDFADSYFFQLQHAVNPRFCISWWAERVDPISCSNGHQRYASFVKAKFLSLLLTIPNESFEAKDNCINKSLYLNKRATTFASTRNLFFLSQCDNILYDTLFSAMYYIIYNIIQCNMYYTINNIILYTIQYYIYNYSYTYI